MSTQPFNLVYIGAGHINFGSIEGPWNHSIRLEKRLGDRLNVLAIIDPNLKTAQDVLSLKQSTVKGSYAATKLFPNWDAFLKDFEAQPGASIDAVFVGSPPAFRGSVISGRDIELVIVGSFPDPATRPSIFLEKPLSTDTVANVKTLSTQLAGSNSIICVGYFLRYLAAIAKMKEIIKENNLTVVATVARYVCSYSHILKRSWWTKSMDCGPIVEQATHFVDLSRYFGGDILENSVQANSVEHFEPAGKLATSPELAEESIPDADRIPRVTTAFWKYQSGAVGSLVHALVLQGTNYSTELTVYADGYELILQDAYNAPRLLVRTPLSDESQIFTFEDDDPYYTQVDAFVTSAEKKIPAEAVFQSSFEDAAKTYELTWAIRLASEKGIKAKAN